MEITLLLKVPARAKNDAVRAAFLAKHVQGVPRPGNAAASEHGLNQNGPHGGGVCAQQCAGALDVVVTADQPVEWHIGH